MRYVALGRPLCTFMATILMLTGCTTSPAQAVAPQVPGPCNASKPALMIVSGRTLDKKRMAEYSRVLAESGLYVQTGGVYLNNPRPLRAFEGTIPSDFVTLVVRFPSECAAVNFWNSDVYQQRIKPLRENPAAGNYSVIVYEALAD